MSITIIKSIKDRWLFTLIVILFLSFIFYVSDFFNFILIGSPIIVAYFWSLNRERLIYIPLFILSIIVPYHSFSIYTLFFTTEITTCGIIIDIQSGGNGRTGSYNILSVNDGNKIHKFDSSHSDNFHIDNKLCAKYHLAPNGEKFGVKLIKER